MRKFKLFKYKFSKTIHYAKTYLYLMVCVIGAMSLASCSEDSISPDAGGDGDGDSTTEVPLAQVANPNLTLGLHRKSIVLRTSIRLRLMLSRLLSRMELSISIFPSVR